jgi:thiamine kinase
MTNLVMHKPVLPGHWLVAGVATFLAAITFPHPLIAARPLSGGFWNDVFRLDTDGGRFTLKHYLAVLPDSLYPNLPDQEAAALTRLAGLDVAPQPVGYWPEHKVLIYRYVDGDQWTDDFAAVAALLRRKEAASPEGFRRVPITPPDILAEGDRLYARCTPDHYTKACLAVRPAARAIAPLARLSLIHTDIGPTNMIGAGDALRVIDWQCPAAGDLTEDIYSFLSPVFRVLNFRAPLLPGDELAFFTALAWPEIESRYHLLRPYFSFRMLGYCCLRSQTAEDDKVVSRYRNAIEAELSQ